ncbi:MAG: CDP-glucose 4,6-dehydratase [Deltaproteobacteria bacterium]|nr:CDP-glucose 4,6-dehydratase [Deltaproteobacteria bacterium]
MIDRHFWKNKKVFLTGHTGFKGSWLSMWLHSMGAEVTGYALEPNTEPNLFEVCNISGLVHSHLADIRETGELFRTIKEASPEIVIHMAAQPLVRESYKNPAETYSVNVMGTVNLLEAVRRSGSVRAVVNVTTDKCYENKEWEWGYRELDRLGGYDPYSNSKACSELVTSAYRNSFFSADKYEEHKVALASARAGNVIGGGDWAHDRLIPDFVRAVLKGEEIFIRNPYATRPWQHVLEPLGGYLLLAEKLYKEGTLYAEGWNFGPNDEDAKTVGWMVKEVCHAWGGKASFSIDKGVHPHEAKFLKLDCSKAKLKLGWQPRWNVKKAIEMVIEWTRAYEKNDDMRQICLQQIEAYEKEKVEV